MTHHVLHAALRHPRQGEAFAAPRKTGGRNRLLTRDFAQFPVALLAGDAAMIAAAPSAPAVARGEPPLFAVDRARGY